MRLNHIAVALAFAGALGLMAAPADAAPRHKRIYSNRDRTVVVSRDENGRTRTRIIIQKRSYLDPGTEASAERPQRAGLRATPEPARR